MNVRKYEELLSSYSRIKRDITVLKMPIDEVLSGVSWYPFSEKDDPVFSEISSVFEKIKLCRYDEGELLSDGEKIIREGLDNMKNELTEKGPLYIKLGLLAAALFTVLVI